jgi:hypothetical protein
MAIKPAEQRTPDDKSESDIDHSIEDTFPASDPATGGGTTRIESDDGAEDEDAKEGTPE